MKRKKHFSDSKQQKKRLKTVVSLEDYRNMANRKISEIK